MKNYAHLIFIDPVSNHNKFYEITENDDSSLDVKYGRVGQKVNIHHYTPHEKTFQGLVYEKERKGYKNDTRNYSELKSDNGTVFEYRRAEDKEVQDIFEHLLRKTRQVVKANYTIETRAVTGNMLYSADYLISGLKDEACKSNPSVWYFNNTLTELFGTIPRKMSDVSAYLCGSASDMDKIIEREEKLLETLKTAYELEQKEKKLKAELAGKTDKGRTLPESLGLTVRPVTYAEEKEIRELLGNSREADFEALRIVNHKSHEAFEKCRQEMNIPDLGTKLLFHGSRAENWLSILEKSLVVNADRLGLAKGCAKGLGNGLYFADDVSKSLNYTHGNGDSPFIGIYNVAVGKMWDTNGEYIGHTRRNGADFGFKDLKDGCQSVFLDGKKINSHHLNEYCVYKGEQADIKYILKCNGMRQKAVRFSMKLEFDFENLVQMDDGMVKADAVLTDYAKKELSKLFEDRREIREATGFIDGLDTDSPVFRLCVNGQMVPLKKDENDRLFHDFKASFFESEKAFKEYGKNFREKAEPAKEKEQRER